MNYLNFNGELYLEKLTRPYFVSLLLLPASMLCSYSSTRDFKL